MLGEVHLTYLSEHLGGTDRVPACLNGSCHCPDCMDFRSNDGGHEPPPDGPLGLPPRGADVEPGDGGIAQQNPQVLDRSYHDILRFAILGFLLLWLMIALVAGVREPDINPT
jgi:hypothetical protein